MIKFLLFIFTTVILYLFFGIVTEYDADVHISFLNYMISIRGFFLVICLFTSYLIFMIIVKFLSFICNAPTIISKFIKSSKSQQHKKKLIECYAMLVSGNYKGSYELINKIRTSLPTELYLDSCLILSLTENDDERRLSHLKYLLDFSEYKDFAHYELARYFFQHQYWRQSLEYAENISNSSKDIDTLELLINLYIKLEDWENFEDTVVTLRDLKPDYLSNISSKISSGYFMAAKNSLGTENNNQAIYYLEQALIYKPSSLEVIELLCYLNNNNGKTKLNDKIIESAFTLSPSFELFLIYHKSSTLSSKQIYSYLASLSDPKNHLSVFLSIAAYLRLGAEIDELKASVAE